MMPPLSDEQKHEALMWAIKAELDSDWVQENYEPIRRIVSQALANRNAEWNRAIGYEVTSLVLTPAEAKGWLEKDRVTRARNVAAARQQRGPVRW